MNRRLAGLATLVALASASPLRAQVTPTPCDAPSTAGAVRLALLVTDANAVPFSGIGRVTVTGSGIEPSPAEEPRAGFIEYWYCSAELPRGRYTIEVRTLAFDCTEISLPETDSGLVVRLIRLRPDPWRPPPRGRHVFAWSHDEQLELAAELGSRRCGVS